MRAVMLAGLVACTTSPPPYTVDDYQRDLGTMHCQRMQECCTPSEYMDWWTADSTGDTYSCIAAHTNPPDAAGIKAGITTGTILFDVTAAHACVAALANLACMDFEPGIRFRETYCSSPFTGTINDGELCTVDEECVGTWCKRDAGGHGMCRSRISDGGACTYIDACADGDFCQFDTTQTCSRGLPAGATCSGDPECADDWCKGAGFLTSGHCVRACDGQ